MGFIKCIICILILFLSLNSNAQQDSIEIKNKCLFGRNAYTRHSCPLIYFSFDFEMTNFELTLYDRWGNKLYQTETTGTPIDLTQKVKKDGKMVLLFPASSVIVWVCSYTEMIEGKEVNKATRGYFTILD